MSTLTVAINAPAPNSTVARRTFTVAGNTTLHLTSGRSLFGSVSVSVQFGVGGPSFPATFTDSTHWECTGSPAAGIRPNSPITVLVTASATLRFFNTADRTFDFEDISGSRSVNVVLPGPVGPTL